MTFGCSNVFRLAYSLLAEYRRTVFVLHAFCFSIRVVEAEFGRLHRYYDPIIPHLHLVFLSGFESSLTPLTLSFSSKTLPGAALFSCANAPVLVIITTAVRLTARKEIFFIEDIPFVSSKSLAQLSHYGLICSDYITFLVNCVLRPLNYSGDLFLVLLQFWRR
jgi:hypothetical protein